MPSGQSRSPQQRLFTGALFTETLNAQLFAFARRHNLRSNVWVPRKAVDTALKPYGVYVLPRAFLCDVTLTPGGGMGDVTAAIGTDRVLVNAEQTSHQQLLEHFREFMVANPLPPPAPLVKIDPHALLQRSPAAGAAPPPTPSALREYFSAVDGADEAQTPAPPAPILLPEPSWDSMPPFQHPLALNGSPFLGSETARRLAVLQAEDRSWSVYWRRLRGNQCRTPYFLHVNKYEFPGRYNPHFCVRYTPHTYTNLNFPPLTAQLMRHRAVEHRYVSRLWLTLRQAEELFGAHLLPERAQDEPVVFCRYFSAGMEATAYYCADQFDDAAGAFPCASDIALATRGVWVAPEKLRAYPLLTRLHRRYAVGEPAGKETGDRTGVDLAMADVGRHSEFSAHRERCAALELHGFWTGGKQKAYENITGLSRTLARQCLLCDYTRPLFFSHRTLLSHGLALREGEQGVVQTRAPVRLMEHRSWVKGECWFNVAQLEEAAAAAELHDHPPRHFLTRQELHSHTAVQCCHAQLARRRGRSDGNPAAQGPGGADNEWLPAYVLEMTGWRLRDGARGVPYVPLAAGASFKRFPVGENFLFQMDDVELSESARSWLRCYAPVDTHGRPFLRGARQAMTLRAFERGYQSPRWLVYRRGTPDHPGSPLVHLRPYSAPVSSRLPRPLLRHTVFRAPPLVCVSGTAYVNAEELAEAPRGSWRPHLGAEPAVADGGGDDWDAEAPLQRYGRGERAMTERGRGVSAEAVERLSAHRTRSAVADDDDDRDGDPWLEGGVVGGYDEYCGVHVGEGSWGVTQPVDSLAAGPPLL